MRATLVIVLVATASAPTWAQLRMPMPSSQTDDRQPAQADGDYRYQLRLADAGAVLFMLAGTASGKRTLALASFGTFVAAGPVIHGANGHHGRAAASLAVRAGLPIGAGVLPYTLKRRGVQCGELYEQNREQCDFGTDFEWLALGAAAGVLAVVIDHHVIYRRPAVRVSPVLSPSPDGATIGLRGAF
ncbi:MAG: hypothetical protein KJO07_22250 [Deltaproteobacteria bacterium]|nr:hypothetical protein [Deltaproteobacteria bacterium]